MSIEKRSKSEFIEEQKKHIENRKKLAEIYNDIILPAVLKFDGKVLNKRFLTYIKNQTSDIALLNISCSSVMPNEYYISFQYSAHNYNEMDSLYFNVVLSDKYLTGARIDYQKTKEDKTNGIWMKNFLCEIKNYQFVIDNYDAYLQQSEELNDMIDKYSRLPISFRKNIHLDNVYCL